MLYRFSGGWIETKEPWEVSVKERMHLISGNTVPFLKTYILAWSEKEPINEYTLSKLDSSVAQKITADVYEELESFHKAVVVNLKQVEMIFKSLYEGSRIVKKDPEIFSYLNRYLELVPFFFDHRGNIIHFPNSGGLLDQPYEFLIILTAAQKAMREILERQSKGVK